MRQSFKQNSGATDNQIDIFTIPYVTNMKMSHLFKLAKITTAQHSIWPLSRRTVNKVIDAIVFTICLIGSLYQVMKMSDLYFRYETITTVTYEIQSPIQVPGLTICAPKIEFLRPEAFLQLFGTEKNKSSDSQDFFRKISYLNKMTIKDQFRVLYSAQELSSMLSQCQALGPNGRYRPCHWFSNVQIAIDFIFYCFTLFDQNRNDSSTRFRVTYPDRMQYDSMFLISVVLPDLSDYYMMALHSRKVRVSQIFGYEVVAIDFSDKTQKTLFEYQRTVVKRLPHPYGRGCVQYYNNKFMSTLDCMVTCRIKYSVEHSEPIYRMFLVSDPNTDVSFELDDNSNNTNAEKACHPKCSQRRECFQINFEIQSLNWQKTSGERIIKLKLPTKPSIIYEETPRLKLEEYLCYLASITNLWFGFSVVMLSRLIRRILGLALRVQIRQEHNQKYNEHSVAKTQIFIRKHKIENISLLFNTLPKNK